MNRSDFKCTARCVSEAHVVSFGLLLQEALSIIWASAFTSFFETRLRICIKAKLAVTFSDKWCITSDICVHFMPLWYTCSIKDRLLRGWADCPVTLQVLNATDVFLCKPMIGFVKHTHCSYKMGLLRNVLKLDSFWEMKNNLGCLWTVIFNMQVIFWECKIGGSLMQKSSYEHRFKLNPPY